jgi:NAD(P)-dependent dehydrogenase (short-subunit alcohol dehydrogenase family)
MKTVVVTGSAGLIGSECVRRFQTHYPDWAYRHDLPAILEAVPWAQAGGG